MTPSKGVRDADEAAEPAAAAYPKRIGQSMYPNDEQFKETTITNVRDEGEGYWSIQLSSGWHFIVPATSPVEPKEGMVARFYGKGIGFAVRGLFLDGQKVFYRTEAEDNEKYEIDTYGADAADWLKRWDEGRVCWSIEMGGLGPGYEQCIHITAAEILRHLLERKYEPETWDHEPETWNHDRKEIEDAVFANRKISAIGISGSQWGAAMNLASQFYRRGPRAVMTDDRVKDRHIQVQRTFPVAE